MFFYLLLCYVFIENRTYAKTEITETSKAAIWQKTYLTNRSPTVKDWVDMNPSNILLKPEAMEFKPLAIGTKVLARACMKP
jgi:hypothetical protein